MLPHNLLPLLRVCIFSREPPPHEYSSLLAICPLALLQGMNVASSRCYRISIAPASVLPPHPPPPPSPCCR